MVCCTWPKEAQSLSKISSREIQGEMQGRCNASGVLHLAEGGAELVEDLEQVEDDTREIRGDTREMHLAEGGAELVEDLEQVEDDVELEHRLVSHRVVGLRHVDAEQHVRDLYHTWCMGLAVHRGEGARCGSAACAAPVRDRHDHQPAHHVA